MPVAGRHGPGRATRPKRAVVQSGKAVDEGGADRPDRWPIVTERDVAVNPPASLERIGAPTAALGDEKRISLASLTEPRRTP